MSSSDDNDEDREIVGYRLIIECRGPNYSDAITIEDDDPISLEPGIREIAGVSYERYGDETDFVEIKSELIVSRLMKPVYADEVARAREEQIKRGPEAGGTFGEILRGLDVSGVDLTSKGEKI